MLLQYRLRDTAVFESQPLVLSVLTRLVSVVSRVEHTSVDVASGRLSCVEEEEERLAATLRSLGFRVDAMAPAQT